MTSFVTNLNSSTAQEIAKLGHDCRRVRSHRRRHSTRQLSCVGVGGVYWALVNVGVYHMIIFISPPDDDEGWVEHRASAERPRPAWIAFQNAPDVADNACNPEYVTRPSTLRRSQSWRLHARPEPLGLYRSVMPLDHGSSFSTTGPCPFHRTATGRAGPGRAGLPSASVWVRRVRSANLCVHRGRRN